MEKRRLAALCALVCLASCAREAWDPFPLAPTNSYSTWTPLDGNKLVSSQFCETLVPPSFGQEKLALADLLDVALQNNPTTKQTWADARAAAAQYGQSLSPFSPQLDGQGIASRMRSYFTLGETNIFVPYYLTTYGPNLNLSYTLFDFGQRSAKAESARQALAVADWNHNFQIQAVIQTVMDGYYTYLLAQAQLKAREADLLNANATLDAANQRFAMGIASLGEVAQARTSYLQTKINATDQRQEVENAFARLATNIGLPANIPFQVIPLPDHVEPSVLMDDLEELVARAQSNRQDLYAARAQLCEKQADLDYARSQVYPVLGSTAQVGRYNYNDGLHERYHFTAQVTLSFPIFRGFFFLNGIRKAKADLEASKAGLMQTELNIVRDVTTAHMGIQTSASNLTDSEEYFRAAELEYKIALENYQQGTGSLLDLLSAQASLSNARARKASATSAWFTSLAGLAFATGTLCGGPCTD